MKQSKIITELLIFGVTLLISVFVMIYVSRHFMYSQTEKEEEANLKRLFGDAWREAKDL